MQRCLFSKRTLRGRSLCFVLEMINQVTPPDTCSVQAPSGGVTDAKLERPLDTSLAYACCYTKNSQEIVKAASAACRSKPRSNTKKDRTLPAKSALKQVEAHSRKNKSNEKQKNHVDSSISYKRTIINSNSNTSCKTCNKCLISVNHDKCVMRSEMFGKQSPATKVWRVKQVWKAMGKLFTTIGHQWRPTGRLLPLGDQ
ncbi:hypothetical protein Tco_1012604 [Tanacetum coccineum]